MYCTVELPARIPERVSCVPQSFLSSRLEATGTRCMRRMPETVGLEQRELVGKRCSNARYGAPIVQYDLKFRPQRGMGERGRQVGATYQGGATFYITGGSTGGRPASGPTAGRAA